VDTAWIAVIGGAVGGAIGVVGGVTTQLLGRQGQRADRREDMRRADHLRYIDERKLAYAEWSVAAREVAEAFWRSVAKGLDNPLPVPDRESGIETVTEKLRTLRSINARITLISKRDVRDAMEAF